MSDTVIDLLRAHAAASSEVATSEAMLRWMLANEKVPEELIGLVLRAVKEPIALPSVVERLPVQTPQRVALIREHYPTEMRVKDLLALLNATPGGRFSEVYLRMIANNLGLRRPDPEGKWAVSTAALNEGRKKAALRNLHAITEPKP